MTIDSTTKVYLGGVEQVKILKNGLVIWEKQQPDTTNYFYIQNDNNGQNTISFTATSQGTVSGDLYTSSFEVSKDKETWTTTGRNQSFVLEEGERLYFRNNNGKFNYCGYSGGYIYNCTVIRGSTPHSCGGDLKSLIDYEHIRTVVAPTGCFARMFYQDTYLTNTPDMSGIEVNGGWTFRYSYYQCISLNTITAFPIGNYGDRTFQYAFKGCTGLVNIPVEIDSTYFGSWCFYGCFEGCNKLEFAPVLKETVVRKETYRSFFQSCTKLKKVITYANDISGVSCLNSWLSSVAATGDFYNLGSATYPSGPSGIPSGWAEHKLLMTGVVLTPATGTEYSVTANVVLSPSLTWTSADIIISDSDSGAGTRSATLTFTPGEVVNGVLTPANNIDINFQDPDTWFELIVYNNGTVVDTQTNIPYTVQ